MASKERCPRCGSGTHRRVGRNGPFVGCKKWPQCKWSRSADSGESRVDAVKMRRGSVQVVTTDYLSAFRDVLSRARGELWIAAMNLEPSGAILEAVKSAASRVATRLYIAADSSERFGGDVPMISALAPAEIWVPRDASRLQHAKFAITDGIAILGSANLTTTAMVSNFELGAIIRGREVDALRERWRAYDPEFRILPGSGP